MHVLQSAKKMIDNINIQRKLRKYLVQDARDRGEPWRNKDALKKTISDVWALDEDLKEYVLGFLNNQSYVETTLGCEIVSIAQLLQSGEFSPVTAALYIQWYRRDPKNASMFLLQRDTIIDLPTLQENEICDADNADEVEGNNEQ